MRMLVFGSLNLDIVFQVPFVVRPGETVAAAGRQVLPGGKGLNQAIALARAGANISMAGTVGPDGDMLLDIAVQNGVDITPVRRVQEPTGQAIIQVDAEGQNSIIVFGGANRQNDAAHMQAVLAAFAPGDWLLLQNEINGLPRLMELAKARGMQIALNPSPWEADALPEHCLALADLFFLNELEAAGITGATQPQQMLDIITRRFPHAEVVITLGAEGALCANGNTVHRHGSYQVPVVDTTAAGDTFTGYYLAAQAAGLPMQDALHQASVAAALAVSRPGAAVSIPLRAEVLAAKLDLR